MSTKKPTSERKAIRQNHEQNYDDGRSTKEPTSCALCCCASCTGFKCPWETNKEYAPDWLKLSVPVSRCRLCHKNADFKRIYDCDFYTYYKRKRYYVLKKVTRRKKKIDLITEKLDLILKKLDGER